MFTSIRSVYGALGVMLFLVALYLVLEHGTATTQLIQSIGGSGSQIFKTLQGR